MTQLPAMKRSLQSHHKKLKLSLFATVAGFSLALVCSLRVFSAGPAVSRQVLDSFHGSVGSGLTAENCQQQLSAWASSAEVADPRAIFPRSEKGSVAGGVTADVRNYQEEAFAARLELREKFATLPHSAQQSCSAAVRKAYGALRAQEDMACEWRLKSGDLKKGKPTRLFEREFNSDNRKFQNWKFKPGDLIIERGSNHFSSFIARMADEKSVFSHLIMIGQDGNGRLYAVETEGQTDARTTPLEQWLKEVEEKNGARYALYRFNDATTAGRAARVGYEQVSQREAAGDPIRYDFHLNQKDSSEMSCTEIAQWSYGYASRGRVQLPAIETRLENMKGKNLAVLDRMEIFVRHWFAPGDVDVDSRFELVSEFRDCRKLREARQADAVSDSLIQWMAQKNYSLRDDPALWAVANVASGLRQVVPLMPFSDRTPPGMIESVLKTDALSEAVQSELRRADEAHLAKHGVAMSHRQLMQELEEIRRRDCESYRRSEKTIFHDDFGPPSHTCPM